MFLAFVKEEWRLYFHLLFLALTIQEHVFAIVIALLMSSLTYYSQKDVLNSTRAVVLNKFTVSLSSILICILLLRGEKIHRIVPHRT